MSEGKKKRIRKTKTKVSSKYDIVVAIDATFEDIVKAGLGHNPRKKPEVAK